MFDEPIKTILQAKEYFRAMGCSHFHMSREYSQRYEEYKQLNITNQTEIAWRNERFDEYYVSIMENKADIPLWNIHSYISSLFEDLKTDTTLIKLLEVTQHIRDKVPLNDRVIVAETINGRTLRKARRGLIYFAYDLNNTPIAKSFVELSLHFSTSAEKNNRNVERCRKATKLCKEIKFELGL